MFSCRLATPCPFLKVVASWLEANNEAGVCQVVKVNGECRGSFPSQDDDDDGEAGKREKD